MTVPVRGLRAPLWAEARESWRATLPVPPPWATEGSHVLRGAVRAVLLKNSGEYIPAQARTFT